MKRIKYGRLYWLQIEAADIDKFILVRIFRKLGIVYIPFTLRFYDELYLREDRSKFSRRLINACRKLGIVTYVVQEGPIYHAHQLKWSHLPLYADIFLCPPADHDKWVGAGMPKDRIRTYDMQRKTEDYTGVFFLEPLVTWAECPDASAYRRNARILKTVYDMLDQDVLFRPDPRHEEKIIPFLPPHRVVRGSEAELVRRYAGIRCFSGSAAEAECRKTEKSCIVVDKDQPLPVARRGGTRQDDTKDQSTPVAGVALLGSFITWNDLAFTWRRDYYNVRIFESLAELSGKNVAVKPHYARYDLMAPFLPPDRVIWDSVESLIKKHDTIYCFADSSVRQDCEMLGKSYTVIGAGECL